MSGKGGQMEGLARHDGRKAGAADAAPGEGRASDTQGGGPFTAATPSHAWPGLPVAVVTLDAEGRVRDANSRAEELLGASCKKLLGKPLVAHLATEPALKELLVRARQEGGNLVLHDVPARRLGARGVEEMTLDMHLAAAGETGEVAMVLIPRHVAERIDRSRAARSLARSAIGMAAMLAHEIRNPLAGISGAAQLLAMNASGEDRSLTRLILDEVRRIQDLVDQVDEFGDLRPPQRAPVNIHDVLERVRRSAEISYAAHVILKDAYDPSLPPVSGDAGQLVQVFTNLVRNAAEAAPAEGGQITLRSYYERQLIVPGEDGRRLVLPIHVEVIDNGPGINPEMVDRVFEPFVSGREAGSGLGLALASKIIAAHEGAIEVESRPGRTVFRVSLPRADGV